MLRSRVIADEHRLPASWKSHPVHLDVLTGNIVRQGTDLHALYAWHS